jgi:hypothetical protein
MHISVGNALQKTHSGGAGNHEDTKKTERHGEAFDNNKPNIRGLFILPPIRSSL